MMKCTILIALGVLTGCGQEPSVETYETSKPAGVELIASQTPTVQDGLVYTPPVGWHDLGATSMVMAQYEADGLALLTVSRADGNLVMNINRWRGQLGLPALRNQVDPSYTTIQSEAGPVMVLDLVSRDPHPTARRFRISLLLHKDQSAAGGSLWFFKFDGPSYVIDEHQAAFDAFLTGLHWQEDEVKTDG